MENPIEKSQATDYLFFLSIHILLGLPPKIFMNFGFINNL